MIRALTLIAASVACAGTLAATASSQFAVQLVLVPAGEQCTSETRSQPGAAVIQVICGSGNFVRIEPAPGSFIGAQSSGFRYYIQNVSTIRGGYRPPEPATVGESQGLGTVTGFHLVSDSSTDNLFELLISF